MAKLAEKSLNVLNYLQANDNGQGIAVTEIAEALGVSVKSVIPCVTLSLGKAPKDGSRGVLASYDKRVIEGVEKPVGYAVLTEEGMNFTSAE